MTKYELARLKKLLNEELQRRKRINELLELETTIELQQLLNLNLESYDMDNYTRSILELLLKSYKISKTNGIYVCTDAIYFIDAGYNHAEYESCSTRIDSEYAERKYYKDIESGLCIKAVDEKEFNDIDGLKKRPTIKNFEKSHIILNPYNENSRMHEENGYNEVRLDFFEDCVKLGQPKALNRVLAKYPKL